MEPNTQPKFEKPKGRAGLWTAMSIVVVVAIVVIIYFVTPKSSDAPVDESMGAPVTTSTESSGSKGGGSSGGSSSSGTTGNGYVPAGNRKSVTPSFIGLDIAHFNTFPERVQAHIRVNLPNPCSELDEPKVTLSGKTFTIAVTASAPKDAVCAQTVTLKEQNVDIPIVGLAAGKYTVKLGSLSKTFSLVANNNVEYMSDK